MSFVNKSIAREYGKSLLSQLSGKTIIEIIGDRRGGLLKNVIDTFGEETLFINTLKGYEKTLKGVLDESCTLYTLSESYFDTRLHVENMKGLRKLVKQFVNELVAGIKMANWELVIIYRANDLPPTIFGFEPNITKDEFWRLLTMDLRTTDSMYLFVYEETDYQLDILPQFADAIIRMSNSASPQVWSVL